MNEEHDINTPDAWEETKRDGTLPFLIVVAVAVVAAFVMGILVGRFF